MPAFKFNFSGPPVFGSPFVSDWLDISMLRSSGITKQIVVATIGSTNTQNILTQVQLSGDDITTPTPTPYDFEAPLKGNNQNMVRDFAANLVRISISGLPQTPDGTLVAYLGVEFDADASVTAFGAFLNNVLRTSTADTTIAKVEQGVVADMSVGDVATTLPPASTAAPGETHTLLRKGATHTCTFVPDGTDTINGVNAAVTIIGDGDAIIVSRDSATSWRIASWTQAVGVVQARPAPVDSFIFSPVMGSSVSLPTAGTRLIPVPDGVTVQIDDVVVAKTGGAGLAGDVVQVLTNALVAVTDAMDLNVSDDIVVRPTTIAAATKTFIGPTNIVVRTLNVGGNCSCDVDVKVIRIA